MSSESFKSRLEPSFSAVDPESFKQLLKPKFIGSGYTLKKKYADEFCQILANEKDKQQHMNDELKTALQGKQQAEDRCYELSASLKASNDLLQEEQKSKAFFKAEFESLSNKFKALQDDFDMKQLAAGETNVEKDEKLQQLTHALEKTVAEHQVQIHEQQGDYEQMHKQFSDEKIILEQSNRDLGKKLEAVQKETSERREQLESDVAAALLELEKLKHAKAEIEGQLEKECGKNASKIRDLSSLLDEAKQIELNATLELEDYKRRNREAHASLKEVLFGQSQERDGEDGA